LGGLYARSFAAGFDLTGFDCFSLTCGRQLSAQLFVSMSIEVRVTDHPLFVNLFYYGLFYSDDCQNQMCLMRLNDYCRSFP